MSPASGEPSVVFLTGASAGLGLAIARELGSAGFRRVLGARRESLGRFAGAGIRDDDRTLLVELDVTDPDGRAAAVEAARRRFGRVDALVNNAGVAYRAVVEHWDDSAWDDIMAIDVRAPMELARLVLPEMRRRRSGRVINISSVGGMMAMPTMSLYSAAKFALEGATEALWYEVRPWGVHATLVEPGFIRSDSFQNTRFTRRSFAAAMDEDDAYHAHYLHMAAFIQRVMERTVATPETVARRVVGTLWREWPPLRVYATPDAHVFALLRRLLPRGLYHHVLYRSLPHVGLWG
jgi:NAD(P)-dependent dehydrogenase (short-subunit alcohol dehydrogenase family)